MRSDPMYLYYDGPYLYYRVAPNPVNGSFKVSQAEANRKNALPLGRKDVNTDIVKVQIVDKTGQVVLQQTYPPNTRNLTIHTAHIKPDVYTVRLFTKDKVESHKIIIQR